MLLVTLGEGCHASRQPSDASTPMYLRLLLLSLHCVLSLAAQCSVAHYQSCLFAMGGVVCVFVCGSVTTVTQICVHRPSPNWVRRRSSDHLQLIKFWPSGATGKGVCGRAQIFGFALLQPLRSVCVSPNAFKFDLCVCVCVCVCVMWVQCL